MLCLLPALAGAITSSNQQPAWRALLLDIRDRGLAVEQAAGVTPLAATHQLRIGLGLQAYSTNCWTNGPTPGCATNYELVSTMITATNMLAVTPTNLTASYTNLPAVYTSSYPDASIIWQGDEAIFDLFSSGLYVDLVAISNAGGFTAWRESYPSTNWYWVDTDTNFAGDTWWAFPQHPQLLPVLTLSNAWKYTGLEPLITYEAVQTVTNEVVTFGWQIGSNNVYSTTSTVVSVVTNRTYDYKFTRAVTNAAYRAEIAQARIQAISTNWVTNVVAGVTNVSGIYTTALVQMSRPATVPYAGIPPRLWSNALGRAYFSLPWSTSQPPPSLSIHLTGIVARLPEVSVTNNAEETVNWSTSTNGVPLSNAFYYVEDLSSAWRGVETNGQSNSLIGATVSIVYSNAITTIGDWSGFRWPLDNVAWSQRVAVLSLLWTTRIIPANSPQALWSWTDIVPDTSSAATNYHMTVGWSAVLPACDPNTLSYSNSGGAFPADEACGPDGLVNDAWYLVGGVESKTLTLAWWARGSRTCFDMAESNDVHHTVSVSGRACGFTDDRDVSDEVDREWAVDPGYDMLAWGANVGLALTNLPIIEADVALLSWFAPTYMGSFDRVGDFSALGGGGPGYCWPYDATTNYGFFWGTGDEWVPEPVYPYDHAFVHQVYGPDTSNDLVLAFEISEATNHTTVSSDGLPFGTNGLMVVWSTNKAAGATNLLSGTLTSWITTPPQLIITDEYTTAASFTDAYSTNSGGVTETMGGTMVHAEHYRRERTPANSEGLRRRVTAAQVLFDWHFTNRAAVFQ